VTPNRGDNIKYHQFDTICQSIDMYGVAPFFSYKTLCAQAR